MPNTHQRPLSLWAAALAFAAVAVSPAYAVDIRDIAGNWSIPESGETITIRQNGDWLHPKYGRARIRRSDEAADISVYYEGEKINCFYRVAVADGGNTLILATAQAPQVPEYCPTGRFKSVIR